MKQTLGAPELVVAARTGLEDYKSLCATRLFHDARQTWLQSIWGENRKLTRLCPREPTDRIRTALRVIPWLPGVQKLPLLTGVVASDASFSWLQ